MCSLQSFGYGLRNLPAFFSWRSSQSHLAFLSMERRRSGWRYWGHRVGFHHSAVFRGLADLENRASGASHGHARVHVRRTGCPLPARKRGYERAVVRHRSRETHRQDLFPLHVAKRDVVFSTPPSHVRSGFLPVCACPRRARKAGGGHSLTGALVPVSREPRRAECAVAWLSAKCPTATSPARAGFQHHVVP